MNMMQQSDVTCTILSFVGRIIGKNIKHRMSNSV